jgi:hypothetical protein
MLVDQHKWVDHQGKEETTTPDMAIQMGSIMGPVSSNQITVKLKMLRTISSVKSDIPDKESFTGAYMVLLPEYLEALKSAAFPLIYGQIVLQFCLYHNHHTLIPFQTSNCNSRPLWTTELWPWLCILCDGVRNTCNIDKGMTVMSDSDPRSTRNVDNDGGPSGPRRHGLKLVRRSETRMSERMPKWTSKRSWMARVRIVMQMRTEVQTGSEGAGSDL